MILIQRKNDWRWYRVDGVDPETKTIHLEEITFSSDGIRFTEHYSTIEESEFVKTLSEYWAAMMMQEEVFQKSL